MEQDAPRPLPDSGTMTAMTELTDLGVVDAAEAIRRGDTTARELVDACLNRIAATDEAIQAWVAIDADAARAEATARDGDLREGRPPGSLHGVPIGIKDIIDVAGMTTTAGAPAFAHRHPTRDATLVARLRAAGAVIVGKTVATQFAFKDPAATRNPWSGERTPGGSSSGSAAAVAAGQVPAAVGTQTLGSILRPSAFCGVVGLKGTHGDVPLDGVVPLAVSLDHAGPLARSVADVTRLEAVLDGRGVAVPPLEAPRLVAPPELLALAEPALRERLVRVLAGFEAAGATVAREPLPVPLDPVLEAGWTVLGAEAASAHRATFASHGGEYAPQIAGLVTAGLDVSPADLARAQLQRAAFRAAIVPWFASFDALVSPVAPGPAPRRGEGTGDPTLCAPWSYAGVPAISIPTGLDGDGMPLAVQLVAGPGDLGRLLGVAAWCEQIIGFDARPP
jgi:Asp-tRNA(Asn)/Glu-tRNA(Gln) amidotransferase A subunit family amidase